MFVHSSRNNVHRCWIRKITTVIMELGAGSQGACGEKTPITHQNRENQQRRRQRRLEIRAVHQLQPARGSARHRVPADTRLPASTGGCCPLAARGGTAASAALRFRASRACYGAGVEGVLQGNLSLKGCHQLDELASLCQSRVDVR